MKTQISKRKLLILLLILGIAAAAVGISTLVKQKSYVPADAVITEIFEEYDITEKEWRYTVYIKYTVDGTEYNEVLGYHDSSFAVGKEIQIMYNPENPAQTVEAASTAAVYFTVLGSVFIIAGVIVFIRKR